MGELLTEHDGGGGVDGEGSGGRSPSRQGAKQELLTPETRFRDGGGAPGVFLEFRQLVSRF